MALRIGVHGFFHLVFFLSDLVVNVIEFSWRQTRLEFLLCRKWRWESVFEKILMWLSFTKTGWSCLILPAWPWIRMEFLLWRKWCWPSVFLKAFLYLIIKSSLAQIWLDFLLWCGWRWKSLFTEPLIWLSVSKLLPVIHKQNRNIIQQMSKPFRARIVNNILNVISMFCGVPFLRILPHRFSSSLHHSAHTCLLVRFYGLVRWDFLHQA